LLEKRPARFVSTRFPALHSEKNWMSFRPIALALTALILATALPLSAQVVPSAQAGGLPLVAGLGAARFNMDCGPFYYDATCYMNGITVWIDWNFIRLPGPPLLHGFGLEVEARDLNLGRPSFLSNTLLQDTGSNLRQDTAAGGVIYHWRRYRRLRPYGKALLGLGSIDFPPLASFPTTYRHADRTIKALGGGADIHAWRGVWIRADYEYQIWPNLFGLPQSIKPSGATIGAVFDFRSLSRR
jgi:hypothetical protein